MDSTTELFRVAAKESSSSCRLVPAEGPEGRPRSTLDAVAADLEEIFRRAGARRPERPAARGALRQGAVPARRPRGRDPPPLRLGVRARMGAADLRGEVLPDEHRRRPVLRDRQGAPARRRRARRRSSSRGPRARLPRQVPRAARESRRGQEAHLPPPLGVPRGRRRQDHARGVHGHGGAGAQAAAPAVTLGRVAIVGVGVLVLYYAHWLMPGPARSSELRTVVRGDGAVVRPPCTNSSTSSGRLPKPRQVPRHRLPLHADLLLPHRAAARASGNYWWAVLGGLIVIVVAVAIFDAVVKEAREGAGRRLREGPRAATRRAAPAPRRRRSARR